MKIHIYKWATDKIPLNAIPFYKTDTMEVYEDVMTTYWREKTKIEEFFDFSKIYKWDDTNVNDDELLAETLEEIRWKDFVDNLKKAEKIWPIFEILSFEPDAHMELRSIEREWWKRLIIYSILCMWTGLNFDYRMFFKECNKYFKSLWYEEVCYHFQIAHNLKPDINREDYDVVYRLWATEDYMWYRCYVKKLN